MIDLTHAQRADISARPILYQNQAALLKAMLQEDLCAEYRQRMARQKSAQRRNPRWQTDADIRAIIARHGPISSRAIANHLNRSQSFAQTHCVRMMAEGKLRRTSLWNGKVQGYIYGVVK